MKPLYLPLLALALALGGCGTFKNQPVDQVFYYCPVKDCGGSLAVAGYDWLNGRPNYIVLACDWNPEHVFRLAIAWPATLDTNTVPLPRGGPMPKPGRPQ